jgi:hypothetical protein
LKAVVDTCAWLSSERPSLKCEGCDSRRGLRQMGAQLTGIRSMRHKRIVVTCYGGPEVITVAEEAAPTPRAGEVRVKALAAGVSLPDILARGCPS